MVISRRTFLATGTAATLSATQISPAWSSDVETRWMGCREINGASCATIFDGAGNIQADFPLPGRGHGIIVSPANSQAIIFARRPGNFACVVDVNTGYVIQKITTDPSRHFYGHGCFCGDGKTLYTTENDIETGAGMIIARDADNGFAVVASFPSGGIGPHEVCLMPDGITLAIANGGIRTVPELGRTKLNLDTMDPSLVFLNRHTGEIGAMHRLATEQHQLSIRHMSVASTGIALALQYEGPKTHRMPLLAMYDGSSLRLVETPTTLARSMRNYAGSIVHDPSGEIIAMSCPRGNMVTFWDAGDQSLLGTQVMRDVCGIAAGSSPGEFVIAGGEETMLSSPTSLHRSGRFADTQWDNHLVRIA